MNPFKSFKSSVAAILTIGLLQAAAALPAGQGFVIEHLINPDEIKVDARQVYVVEGIQIHIYSLNNASRITSVGREGEGPGEFLKRGPNPVTIFLDEKQLIVSSLGRLSYFNLKGRFIREVRINPRSGRDHQPLGSGFVARFIDRREDGRLDHGLALYDSQFKKNKEIYRHVHGFPLYRKFDFNPLTIEQPVFQIYKQHVFMLDGSQSVVNVYDREGRLKAELKNQQELRPFTAKDKKEEIDSWLRDSFFKRFYERHKRHFKFPDYFPPISCFYIDRSTGKVYLRTHKNVHDRRIYLVYDQTGRYLNKVSLPFHEAHSNLLNDFYGDKLYQLVEDMDEENWQLHIHPIE